jgi:hypothetical protein
MPRLRTKASFTRDQIVVCWRTIGVSYDIVPEGVIRKGTRLRGNHPWVREFPEHFIDADTPDDEWPNEFAGLAEPPPYESHVHLPDRLPDDELVRCVNSITVGFGGGLGFEKGQLYPKTKAAEMLERFPECFEEVQSNGK